MLLEHFQWWKLIVKFLLEMKIGVGKRGEVESVVSQPQLPGEGKGIMKGRRYVTKCWSSNSEKKNFKVIIFLHLIFNKII